MVSDGQAFNRVKNLLTKLDRSIDDARDKRLGKAIDDSPAIGTGAYANTPIGAGSSQTSPGTSAAASSSSQLLIGQGQTPPSTTSATSDRAGAAGALPRQNAAQSLAPERLSDAPIGVGTSSSAPEAGKSGFGRAKPLTRPAPSGDARRWGT